MSDENKREIQWEDYRENYVESIIEDMDEDFVEDPEEEDDDDDGPGVSQISNFMSSMGLQAIGPISIGQMINTPWGPFSKNNKFAPFNFYELKLAHFKGFSTHSVPNFTDIMDSTDGVAVWKTLDPYCIIIGKARMYKWEEVVKNIKEKLTGVSSQDTKENPLDAIVQATIAKNREDNINEYTAAVFPNGQVVQLSPLDANYAERLAQLEELKKKIALIIIQNGAVKC